VQIEGRALRIRADAMLREFHRGGPLQDLLLRYIQALMIQMSQVAVCNRHHKVEEQVCRWLLMSLDRVAANDIRMTQGLIGTRLGARRTGITEAANRLRNAGLIDYRRGRISVPDRAALVQSACECYRVVTKETERLLGPISRPGATASFWPDVR
jgi:CRP-like cAMP-binding protein